MQRLFLVLALMFVLVILMASFSFADQQVTVSWDRSASEVVGDTTVTQYYLYGSSQSGSYDLTAGSEIAIVPATGAATYTTTLTQEDGIKFFVVTAGNSSRESEPSNEVKSFCGPRDQRVVDKSIAAPVGLAANK